MEEEYKELWADCLGVHKRHVDKTPAYARGIQVKAPVICKFFPTTMISRHYPLIRISEESWVVH